MFSLFSKKISVEAVKKGQRLDKAIEKDVNFFLECRLHNKPRKALVGMWLILFEDEQWIYWGYPVFRMLFSDSRVVDVLYKTERKAIVEIYPEYHKDFQSLEIRLKILDAVRNHEGLKDGINYQGFNLYPNYKINIQDGNFVIKAKGEISYTAAPYSDNPREEKRLQNYDIVLKTDNLQLISIF